jgi:nitrile hydratase beta subunit-like protein
MVRTRRDCQSLSTERLRQSRFSQAIGRHAMRGGELMKWLSYLCSCLQVKRPAVAAGMRARFALGDRVSVREGSSQEGGGTPSYVRGKSGVVEEVDEAFTDSKKLIANRGVTTPLRQMYRMRFVAREVWPDSAPGDTLSLRISEDQLEPSPTKAS